MADPIVPKDVVPQTPQNADQNKPPARGQQPQNTEKTSTTTVAVGVSFDMAESRKFSLDVTALTEVTAEIISVPAPAKLTELLAARFKKDDDAKKAAAATAATPTK